MKRLFLIPALALLTACGETPAEPRIDEGLLTVARDYTNGPPLIENPRLVIVRNSFEAALQYYFPGEATYSGDELYLVIGVEDPENNIWCGGPADHLSVQDAFHLGAEGDQVRFMARAKMHSHAQLYDYQTLLAAAQISLEALCEAAKVPLATGKGHFRSFDNDVGVQTNNNVFGFQVNASLKDDTGGEYKAFIKQWLRINTQLDQFDILVAEQYVTMD